MPVGGPSRRASSRLRTASTNLGAALPFLGHEDGYGQLACGDQLDQEVAGSSDCNVAVSSLMVQQEDLEGHSAAQEDRSAPQDDRLAPNQDRSPPQEDRSPTLEDHPRRRPSSRASSSSSSSTDLDDAVEVRAPSECRSHTPPPGHSPDTSRPASPQILRPTQIQRAVQQVVASLEPRKEFAADSSSSCTSALKAQSPTGPRNPATAAAAAAAAARVHSFAGAPGPASTAGAAAAMRACSPTKLVTQPQATAKLLMQSAFVLAQQQLGGSGSSTTAVPSPAHPASSAGAHAAHTSHTPGSGTHTLAATSLSHTVPHGLAHEAGHGPSHLQHQADHSGMDCDSSVFSADDMSEVNSSLFHSMTQPLATLAAVTAALTSVTAVSTCEESHPAVTATLVPSPLVAVNTESGDVTHLAAWMSGHASANPAPVRGSSDRQPDQAVTAAPAVTEAAGVTAGPLSDSSSCELHLANEISLGVVVGEVGGRVSSCGVAGPSAVGTATAGKDCEDSEDEGEECEGDVDRPGLHHSSFAASVDGPAAPAPTPAGADSRTPANTPVGTSLTASPRTSLQLPRGTLAPGMQSASPAGSPQQAYDCLLECGASQPGTPPNTAAPASPEPAHMTRRSSDVMHAAGEGAAAAVVDGLLGTPAATPNRSRAGYQQAVGTSEEGWAPAGLSTPPHTIAPSSLDQSPEPSPPWPSWMVGGPRVGDDVLGLCGSSPDGPRATSLGHVLEGVVDAPQQQALGHELQQQQQREGSVGGCAAGDRGDVTAVAPGGACIADKAQVAHEQAQGGTPWEEEGEEGEACVCVPSAAFTPPSFSTGIGPNPGCSSTAVTAAAGVSDVLPVLPLGVLHIAHQQQVRVRVCACVLYVSWCTLWSHDMRCDCSVVI